jgi:two-component system sensor histidine kinase KdpD
LWAVVDPVRLEQVLVNLIDNAVKFSPNGSPIRVDLRSLAPDVVELAVADQGPGIPPQARDHIFERFFQVDGQGTSGMGLGLHISRQIVLLHGGTLEAEFPSEGGTCFRLTLPVKF